MRKYKFLKILAFEKIQFPKKNWLMRKYKSLLILADEKTQIPKNLG